MGKPFFNVCNTTLAFSYTSNIKFAIMDKIDPVMTDDLAAGLEIMKTNLLNFVFAALMLGLCCTRSSSKHTTLRGILTSVLHEGMPMVIYSQILKWGQTSLCLMMCCCLELIGRGVPNLFAAMVPLGVEAGNDVIPTPVYNNFWSATVVQEAESLGIVAAVIFGVIAISAKPYLMACGWLGSAYSRESSDSFQSFAGHVEAFERVVSQIPVVRPSVNVISQRVSTTEKLSRMNSVESNGQPLARNAMGSTLGPGNSSDRPYPTRVEDVFDDYAGDKQEKDKPESHASLGTHLSLIALTVFLSFNAGLTARIFETQFFFLKAHRLISGICMYKMSMCCALISMNFFLRRSRIRFRRDWFMRLCGLMLDMLVIAALSTANPKPAALDEVHYGLVAIFVAACVSWNIFSFFILARRFFPNFWYERGLTLTGDALGHSFMGLLFARTLDPTLETPAPLAFAYKLMIFFIPSSGGKNNVVVSIVDSHGPWMALLVCLCVVAAWLIIFEKHFKHRYVTGGAGIRNIPSDRDLKDKGRDRDGLNGSDNDSALDALLLSYESENDSKMGLRRDANTNSALSQLEMAPAGTIIHTDDVSLIITPSQMSQISKWLPESEMCRSWVLKYSLRQHGANLNSLISLCTTRNVSGRSTYSSCVILVEDSWGYVFGGFVAHDLQNNNNYYGNGESFVFSLMPKVDKYKWTGENDFFIISNSHQLAMGGGGEGFAFQLDDELDTGVSNRSDTYCNPTLSSTEFFKCLNVEVWTLENVGFSI